MNQEEYATARVLKEEGVAILRELGNHERLAYALLHLGHLAGFGQGNLLAAQGLYQEALDIFRALANAEGTAHALSNLGAVALLRRAYATAKSLILESLHLYQALGFAYDVATSLGKMAGIAAGFNQPQRAMRLAGAFAAQYAAIGVSQPKAFYERNEQYIAPARRLLSEAEQQTLWAEGQAMTLEQAIAYALDEPGETSTHIAASSSE